MFNFKKTVEILLSLQIIILSSMIPVFISLLSSNNIIQKLEIPLTWQIPSIIIITLIFNGEIVLIAFSLYLMLGLLFLPVFHQGGSLGYLLTPNFGYLLGTYPLIKIIDNLNNKNIQYYEFIKTGILGISSMHIIGIIYSFIQLFYFKQLDTLLYNISNYSLGKYCFHLLMLTPITLIIKSINKYKHKHE